MKNSFITRGAQVLVLLLAVSALGYFLIPMLTSSNPSDAKVAKLSEELRAACQANKVEPQVQLLNDGDLLGVYTPSEFIAKYADQTTSIPYDKKERGRMYPLIEMFDIKENIEFVQLVTCAQDRTVILSRNDILSRPDPLYWMSKRKGFLSVHSMVYDKTSDTSEKTDYRARPLLMINLIGAADETN